jgi:hypothetical protein
MHVSVLRQRLHWLTSTAIVVSACSSSNDAVPHDTHAARAAVNWTGPSFVGAGVAGLGQSIAAGMPALSCDDPTTFTFTHGPKLSSPGEDSDLPL